MQITYKRILISDAAQTICAREEPGQLRTFLRLAQECI